MGTYLVRNDTNDQPETVELVADRIIRTRRDDQGADVVETYPISSVYEWGRVRKFFHDDLMLVSVELESVHECWTFDWRIKNAKAMYEELETCIRGVQAP